jgi:alpha-ribazole phosphatase/probable phosphoglycerate mutase
VSNLLLVRHAETSMAGRFCGHSDPELNEPGRHHLVNLVNRLSAYEIRHVYSSDLRRAQQTAAAIATHFGVNLHLRPGLREIHFGLWEGLTWEEIQARDPLAAKSWAENCPNVPAPGGESFRQFASRTHREIDFLLEEAAKAPVAVVTHAGLMRVVLTTRCGLSEAEAWEKTRDYLSILPLMPSRAHSGCLLIESA